MKKLFIITGEYSGDKHASNVVKEIKRLNPDIEIEAVGGDNLKNLGVKLYCDHSQMSAMGFNCKIIYKHIMLGREIANYIKNVFKPDMVLMIDYGGFNLNLSKVLSGCGIKLYYYIPPQIWASRKWRLNTVKRHIDKVLTIFPFEKEMYDSVGVDCEYVGHPLTSQMPEKYDRAKFCAEYSLDLDKKLISIFPGSRVFEIKNLLKLFLDSARLIKVKNSNVEFVLCQAPNIKDELIFPSLEDYTDLNIKVVKNKNYEAMSVSDGLILASGTVALEAALYEKPMVISYKGPWFLYMVYLLVRSIKRVSLPNIILNDDIIPELIQLKAKPKYVSDYVLKILEDESFRNKMINSLTNVKNLLAQYKSSEKVAEIIVKNI